MQEPPQRLYESEAGCEAVACHELYTSAGVPAAGDDCSALSAVLPTGLFGAGLSSASSGVEARFVCSLLGLCESASPSCLTGTGVSDEASVCFAMGLLAAAALTVFDSLVSSRCAKV